MITSKAKAMRDLLLSCGTDNVFHVYRPEGSPEKYIIWQEEGEENSHHCDDKKSEYKMNFSIEVYTKDEYDEVIDAVYLALDNGADGFTYDGTTPDISQKNPYFHHSFTAVM